MRNESVLCWPENGAWIWEPASDALASARCLRTLSLGAALTELFPDTEQSPEAINYLDKESRTYPINGSYRLDLSLRLIRYELMNSSFRWATSELELLIGFPVEK
ncbi:unnamed protein product [Bubo scandiacus]